MISIRSAGAAADAERARRRLTLLPPSREAWKLEHRHEQSEAKVEMVDRN
jgi:hypothetical protein